MDGDPFGINHGGVEMYSRKPPGMEQLMKMRTDKSHGELPGKNWKIYLE